MRAWADTLPRFALRPAAFDAGRYNRFQNFLIDSGLLSEAMPIDKVAIDDRVELDVAEHVAFARNFRLWHRPSGQ